MTCGFPLPRRFGYDKSPVQPVLKRFKRGGGGTQLEASAKPTKTFSCTGRACGFVSSKHRLLVSFCRVWGPTAHLLLIELAVSAILAFVAVLASSFYSCPRVSRTSHQTAADHQFLTTRRTCRLGASRTWKSTKSVASGRARSSSRRSGTPRQTSWCGLPISVI